MNKAKLDKEKKNVKLLFQYFKYYGFQLGFWTLMDALGYRFRVEKIYKYSDGKRYAICKDYLRKKYCNPIVKKFNEKPTIPKVMISETDCIWICWWQGEENLPYPVNLCVQSIRRHAGKHPVIVITEKNYREYVDLPDLIIKKLRDGNISLASFSDILRCELLYQYGGIWLDSTYYFTDEIQNDIYERNFFSISNHKGREWVVTKDIWSISFMAMTKGHPIAAYMRECFRTYWEHEDINMAYLLVDCFMSIGYEDISSFGEMMNDVPENNIGVFDLLEPIRNTPCTKEEFENLMGDTYIHKLTYKEKYLPEVDGKKTYYGYLIDN